MAVIGSFPRRQRLAAAVLVIGLVIAFAAAKAAPLAGPPLYDGVPVTEPYVWLDPPPNHPGNPTSATATVVVKGDQSPLVALATGELSPQAQLFAAPGTLILPPGTTSLSLSIKAVEPASLPPDGHIAGNVYRFTVVTQAGGAVTARPDGRVSVVLRAPDLLTTEASIGELQNGTWTELKAETEAPATFISIVTSFADFAVILPGAAPSAGTSVPATIQASTAPSIASTPSPSGGNAAGSGGPPVTLLAGLAMVLVVLGLLATAVLPGRRTQRERRGWERRPPPRTRR